MVGFPDLDRFGFQVLDRRVFMDLVLVLAFMDLAGFSGLEYGTDFQTIGCWFF